MVTTNTTDRLVVFLSAVLQLRKDTLKLTKLENLNLVSFLEAKL